MMALDLVPASHRDNWRIHRVVAGETLAEIARRFATPVSALTSANQHAALNAPGSEAAEGAAPVAGDLLVVPVATRLARVPASAAASSKVASSRGKLSRKATARTGVAARRTPVNTPARKAHASTYHTAGLAAKHHAAVN
jgi:hypothetical protein